MTTATTTATSFRVSKLADPAPSGPDLDTLARRANVPVLPAGVTELLARLADEDMPFDELATLLERFPTVATRLLSIANSPWSAPRVPVTSLDVACARLGFETVRSISIAVTVAAPFNPMRCMHFDASRYWCATLLVADAAARVSRLLPAAADISQATARAAGLLHNLGLLWLADCLPAPTDRALAAAAADDVLSVNEALTAECGFGHNDASLVLAEAWYLPELMRAAMRYHSVPAVDDKQATMTRLIAVSAGLVAMLFEGAASPAHPAFAGLEIEAAALEAVYAQMEENYPRMRLLAESLFPQRP